jgi:DNA-binding response OmpR family regulator
MIRAAYVIMEQPTKMKVLYVEDDPDSIELVTFSLGLEQIEVTTASSAEAALAIAGQQKFDLYLLDGLLDSGYSYELCGRLREQDPDSPVVFYTALGFPQDIKKGVAAGADAYLVKPFVGDLAATLRRAVLDKKRQRAIPLRPPENFCAAAAPLA